MIDQYWEKRSRELSKMFLVLLVIAALVPLLYYGTFILCLELPPDLFTRYAPQYSEERFQRIKIGMSADEVYRQMGRPLGVDHYPSGKVIWAYSHRKRAFGLPHTHKGCFNYRGLVFSNGIVAKIDSALIYP